MELQLGIICLGVWGEGTFPADRIAVGFVFCLGPDDYQIRLINAEETPWGDAEILGHKLTWEEAQDHPDIDEVYKMMDEIVGNDPEVRSFFRRSSVH